MRRVTLEQYGAVLAIDDECGIGSHLGPAMGRALGLGAAFPLGNSRNGSQPDEKRGETGTKFHVAR
jgi:hypothetical protein